MKTLKVLHLYSSWTRGGAEKVMLSLIKGLEKNGVHNILGSPRKSFMFEEARKEGIAAYPIIIKGSLDPVGIFKLWRIMQKEDPDIIHAHQGKVFWPCVFMKWFVKPGIKIVFHRHADIPHKAYSRMHYRWADKVIAISQAVKKGLMYNEGIPDDKIGVIFGGTDFNDFNPRISGAAVRARYNLSSHIVVGTVGAMNRPKGKGQGYLLEAAQKLAGTYPDVRYLIVGDGDILADLKKKARELGVDSKAIFTGYQAGVAEYMAAMDILCLLSWDKEGFGQVMVEAQALGKPVIGTDVGGVPETFINGETGIRIQKENVAALADALGVLLSDAEKRKNMGAAGAVFVRKNFGMDTMIQKIQGLYNTLEEE